jgi:hypothetical protein
MHPPICGALARIPHPIQGSTDAPIDLAAHRASMNRRSHETQRAVRPAFR